MEKNTAIIDIKAIDSGVIRPNEVGQATDPGPGIGTYIPYKFSVPVGPESKYLKAHVTTPSGLNEDPEKEFPTPRHVALKYQPKEAGLHLLHVYYKDEAVKGSPFHFEVFKQESKFLHAFGAGLKYGIVNVPAEFTVVTHAAGASGIGLAIEGPCKADIQCVDNEDGTCTVMYVPTQPGDYNIMIKQGDHYICGSPFTAKITGRPSTSASSVECMSQVKTDFDVEDLKATVKSPSGKIQPCFLKKQKDGHLGFSFSPEEAGSHVVSVMYGKHGKNIPGSPFKVTIQQEELAINHSGNVKVSGDGIKEGITNQPNEFILDTREAGFGDLKMCIEGPRKSHVDMECYDNEDGTCRVVYNPTQKGKFKISIIFGGEHVPGSPFEVEVDDPFIPPPERSFRSASKQGVDLWE
ncbi:hypothetical protein ACF0H5_017870 [Mactra antiquata]